MLDLDYVVAKDFHCHVNDLGIPGKDAVALNNDFLADPPQDHFGKELVIPVSVYRSKFIGMLIHNARPQGVRGFAY